MLNHFKLKENNTTIKQEFNGGLTSFLAAFYIIVVNPAILSQAGLSFSAVATSTIVIAAFSTILMGIFANMPIVLAPGMGLNAFFAFSLILGMKVTPEVALGVVFWSGLIFIFLSVFKVRELLVSLIHSSIRHGVSCGIGVFIAFIGLKNANVISSNPVTLVQMNTFTPTTFIFFIGLFITAVMLIRKVRAALVYGIIFTMLMSITLGRVWGSEEIIKWSGVFAAPDFSLFFNLDLKNSLTLSLIPVMFSFIFTDLFDTLSTLVGVSEASGLVDEKGEPKNLKKSLIADAIATTASALFGSSPTTSFIESAAGVSAGARTGLSSVFAGLLFLPFLFLSPLLSIFPPFVTSPILVIVGVFMMGPIIKIKWEKIENALPAFLAIIIIPLSFSISHGIMAALLIHLCLRLYKRLTTK